jgi:hypothetical protein
MLLTDFCKGVGVAGQLVDAPLRLG